MNRLMRSQREQPLDHRIPLLAAPGHADRLEEQEDRAKLTEGLNALDKRTRQAVTLRHGENLPLREVADRTNLSVSGAKKRSEKGLARLRAIFRRR
jgi:RNA polymerase sigma factor (sigma-70 family)